MRSLSSVLLLAVLLAGCIRQSEPSPSPLAQPHAFYSSLARSAVHSIYLPWIRTAPDADATCFGNPKALAFYRLLVGDERQQHPALRCNSALVKAAQKRAQGLATLDPWAHYDRNGIWANQYARDAGCRLPDGYSNRNQIESLTAGTPDVDAAYRSLTNALANGHRPHLLGETEFFRQQNDVGIGYAEGGAYGFYWVIMIGACW